jgi:hypothetical protein
MNRRIVFVGALSSRGKLGIGIKNEIKKDDVGGGVQPK